MKQDRMTKILKIVLLVLILVLISAISFLGILQKNMNLWENILPDYELARELTDTRVLTFSVDDSTEEVEVEDEEDTEDVDDETTIEVDETVSEDSDISVESEDTETEDEEDEEDVVETVEVAVNPEEILTKENYDKVKSIIEKRLAKAEITDKEVVVDYDSGDISIYVSFEDANSVVSYVTEQGKIEITDTETEEVLISSDMISKVSAYYTTGDADEETGEATYDIGISIDFTKEGLSKLSEVTKTYIDVLDEDGESDPVTVDIVIDGETVYTTYFDGTGEYEQLNIPIYSSVANEEFDTYYEAIKIYEINITTGELPITYVTNDSSYLGGTTIKNYVVPGIIIFIIILAIISIILIIKLKIKGLLCMIVEAGYIACYLLLIRITKETLTIYGLVSIVALALINYALVVKIAKKFQKTSLTDILLDFTLKMVPLVIFAIAFEVASNILIKAVGAVLFWGLLILLPYNIIFTNPIFRKFDDVKKIGGKK